MSNLSKAASFAGAKLWLGFRNGLIAYSLTAAIMLVLVAIVLGGSVLLGNP